MKCCFIMDSGRHNHVKDNLNQDHGQHNVSDHERKSTDAQIPEIVELNVGGVFYTTTLSTLRKSRHSMLSAMFSGRFDITRDQEGRCFIDRDGRLFQHILNFLRQDMLPPVDISLSVYHEAQFYNIEEMCTALEYLRPVAGEKLRKDFLNHVPCYEANLCLLLEKARQIAGTQPERVSKLKVCVFKEEPHTHLYNLPLATDSGTDGASCKAYHSCDVNVTFGPWKATPDVYDLIDCIRHDLADKGYELEQECIGVCDRHVSGQYYCKRPIFEFKFKWW